MRSRKQTAGKRGTNKSRNEAQRNDEPFLSYTAQALLPVFADAKFADREEVPDLAESATEPKFDIRELGMDAKMPWETDGLRWHTKDRVSRKGLPIRWDGKMLEEIIRRIEDSQKFPPVNWNNRSVVEVAAKQKSLGWFMHAITAEEWLLKVKFRVPRNTFNRTSLIARLDLKPLNDMDEIPLYGTEPRVRVISKGRWQEIEIRPHSWKESDHREFWDFLDTSIQEFAGFVDGKLKPSDLMPWKVLGRAWHRLPKGLIGGNELRWDVSLLDKLLEMIDSIARDLRVVWTNKVLVPFYRPVSRRQPFFQQAAQEGRMLPDVVIHTKRVDAMYVDVYVAKNSMPLGRIRDVGSDPYVNGENGLYDILQLRFTEKKQLQSKEFQQLLRTALGE